MKNHKPPLIHTIDLITGKTGAKVKVIRFFVSPKTPKPGDPMKIRFTVQNVSNSLLKLVPWRIVKNKTILYSGYRFNLSVDSSFDVTVSWEAVKGRHFFYTDVDPQNILHESKSKLYNNFPQGVDIVVG